MLRLGISLFVLGALASRSPAQERVPFTSDPRVRPVKTLNDYFPFTPPKDLPGWSTRVEEVRTRILVANGLWPEPEKAPLDPIIHGKIQRDGYTIEKVTIRSLPGHYVTGNLYRPTSATAGTRPAILNPHGHWKKGRFEVATDAEAKKLLETKAEATPETAKYFIQGQPIGLVRQGYIVFQFDMVGYADSTAIAHREGFLDAEAELRSQSFMGLQTWNCVRAFDFLASLPDVDTKKIGVTGASGGGTQTFLLAAIDPRPAAIFPAVMVSTAMQGGCICENCSHLRVGTGNVEMAGLFAPKPLAMSGADDWTKEIETKGLPELKQLYRLYGKEDFVQAKTYIQFPHNYNQVAREMMVKWFNLHLQGKSTPYTEAPFVPTLPEQLSVYDAAHSRPKDEMNAKQLREVMTAASQKQFEALIPKDAETLKAYRKVVGAALNVLVDGDIAKVGSVQSKLMGVDNHLGEKGTIQRFNLTRSTTGETLPALVIQPKGPNGASVWNGNVVVIVYPQGKDAAIVNGKPSPEVALALEKGSVVIAIDPFQLGDHRGAKDRVVDTNFAGYTLGYNRSILAERVQDVLTTVVYAKEALGAKSIHLLGIDTAGPIVAIARAQAGNAVARTAVDVNRFRFESIKETSDPMLLPGALKYGGLPGLSALIAPYELLWTDHAGTGAGKIMKAAYQAAGKPDALVEDANDLPALKMMEWLLR
jgi:dienelactone hydrolase